MQSPYYPPNYADDDPETVPPSDDSHQQQRAPQRNFNAALSVPQLPGAMNQVSRRWREEVEQGSSFDNSSSRQHPYPTRSLSSGFPSQSSTLTPNPPFYNPSWTGQLPQGRQTVPRRQTDIVLSQSHHRHHSNPPYSAPPTMSVYPSSQYTRSSQNSGDNQSALSGAQYQQTIISYPHNASRPNFPYGGPVGVRSSQACDACRKRKVRCTVVQPEVAKHPVSAAGSTPERICVRCNRLGIECVWRDEKKGKSRGKQGSPPTAEHASEQSSSSAGHTQSSSYATVSLGNSPILAGSPKSDGRTPAVQRLSTPGTHNLTSPPPSYTAYTQPSSSDDGSYATYNVPVREAHDYSSNTYSQHTQAQQSVQYNQLDQLAYANNVPIGRYGTPGPAPTPSYSSFDPAIIRRSSTGNLAAAASMQHPLTRSTPLSSEPYNASMYQYSTYGEGQGGQHQVYDPTSNVADQQQYYKPSSSQRQQYPYTEYQQPPAQ